MPGSKIFITQEILTYSDSINFKIINISAIKYNEFLTPTPV
ncbi:hypothetical protein OkiPb00104_47120 [Escherichia coli]